MRRSMLVTISAVSFVAASAANAQSVNSQSRNIDNPEVETVYQKERADYTPQGVRAGSFIIKPRVDLSAAYESNIYAAPEDEEDDTITKVRPSVRAESDWSNHELTFDAYSDIAMYSDNDDEDFEDYGAKLSGRVDIKRNIYIQADAGYDNLHEKRGIVGNDAGIEPNEYDRYFGRANFHYGPGKFNYDLNGQYAVYDYDDNKNGAGANLDQDFRDRDEVEIGARLGYEFSDRHEAFVMGKYITREYAEQISEDRDSDGYRVVGGLRFDITGKTKAEVYAGYMEQEYDGENYESIDGVTFGGNLTWNVTPLTSVIASFDRDIEETVIATTSGFVATKFDLRAEHELRRNILLAANAGYEINEYENLENVSTQEPEYDYIRAGVEGKYLINRNFAVGAEYDYENRDSNLDPAIGDADYDNHIFMITFSAGL